MVYESSYESGAQPFLPDTQRGKWQNANDFIYAGLSVMFRFDTFIVTYFTNYDFTYLLLFPLSMVIYTVPLIVIQSYMGQFSSSGFISAFRISPLFKGIGYVSLVMNIVVLAYQSLFAMIPLLYMFVSLKPTLPWSCEGFKMWAHNLTEDEEINLCNIAPTNFSRVLEYYDEESNTTQTYHEFVNHHIPSVLYFRSLFPDKGLFNYSENDFSMCWQLIMIALLVWGIVAVILFKFFKTEMIGTLTRYSVWIVLGLMSLFIVRFSFVAGALSEYRASFSFSWIDVLRNLFAIPIIGLSTFGPGWGLFITLSSFNNFRTNIVKSSYLIAGGQYLITIGLHLLSKFTEGHFNELTNNSYYSQTGDHWTVILSSGSLMAHMTWANLWSILYFFMMFLSCMTLLILQLHSVLTTIFDEFVELREKRDQVSMAIIGIVALLSLYFTSNHGIDYLGAIANDTYITQISINLLLILIVLWMYGRERFQSDMEFMTIPRFPTWHINILRFIAPLGMGLALVGVCHLAYYEHMFAFGLADALAIIFIGIPWIFIPGFVIYHMKRSIGSIKTRFLRCCRPTDWFPVEQEDKQKYENAVGNVEITQTLSELKDQEVT